MSSAVWRWAPHARTTQAALQQVGSSCCCRCQQKRQRSRHSCGTSNVWAALTLAAVMLALLPGPAAADLLHHDASRGATERHSRGMPAQDGAGYHSAASTASIAAAGAEFTARGLRSVPVQRSARRLAASGSSNAGSQMTTVLPMLLQVGLTAIY